VRARKWEISDFLPKLLGEAPGRTRSPGRDKKPRERQEAPEKGK